jgi:hypothetical protein
LSEPPALGLIGKMTSSVRLIGPSNSPFCARQHIAAAVAFLRSWPSKAFRPSSEAGDDYAHPNYHRRFPHLRPYVIHDCS